MRSFDYKRTCNEVLINEIVKILTEIYRLKGKVDYFIDNEELDFTNMKRIARINSIEAGCRITNVTVPRKDINYMLDNNEMVDNDNNHCCIAGYDDALSYVFDESTVAINSDTILELANMTTKYLYYNENEYRNRGFEHNVRFLRPWEYYTNKNYNAVDGKEVLKCISSICSEFTNCLNDKDVDMLIPMCLFFTDFLAIYPFNQSSEKVSKLLISYLLKMSGFSIGEYISIEEILYENLESFYQIWEVSMKDWREDNNDYKEMTKFILRVVLRVYEKFSDFIDLYNKDISKAERIEYILKDRGYETTKRELIGLCPDISETTIEITLGDLVRSGKIEKVGGGRYTSYIYKYHR
jgi:Fic family protein